MNKTMIATIGAGAAALLLLGGVANAAPNDVSQGQTATPPAHTQAEQAQQQDKRSSLARRIPIVEGKVRSVSASTITLAAKAKRANNEGVSVTTVPTTTFYVPGVTTASIADIKPGDRVAVLFDEGASNAQSRVALAVSVLPKPASVIVGGEVSDISAAAFTLTGRKDNGGTVDIGSARIVVPGKSGATINDIQNGDRVIVQGKLTSDSSTSTTSVDATLIVVVPENRDNILGGVIASAQGSTLVVFTLGGEQIKVDTTNAVIFERGATDATVGDLQVGRPVGVIGTVNADGSVTAQLVGQIQLPFFGFPKR